MKNRLFLAVLLAAAVLSGACKKNDTPLSSEKAIITFTVTDGGGNSVSCNVSGTTVSAVLCKGTNLAGLTPVITVSPKATFTPLDAKDFTLPVTCTVTAEDGSTATYTVTLTKSTTACSN
ncbi:MAG: DUF5018 domain-containing protein [Bacteroidales bacterium]|jgi:hypothetical protein|nr:DUF5018 domain-containing protein [Bacteroidales bacterium]